MVHFHRICHENCVLRYVEMILKLRKLDFRGLKGQFNVKKANFRGLIPEISYLRPILTSRTYPWPIIFLFYHGIFALRHAGGILEVKKLDFGDFKCQSDVKKSILED